AAGPRAGRGESAGGPGRARAKTVSGDFRLRGASPARGASTLSGAMGVRAAGWQRGGTGGQRGKFESVTGDISFAGELGRGGGVELESQSGNIVVRVPPQTIVDFDVVTIQGTITNTLGQGAQQPKARTGGSGKELRFSTGVGGAQVTVRSFRGA